MCSRSSRTNGSAGSSRKGGTFMRRSANASGGKRKSAGTRACLAISLRSAERGLSGESWQIATHDVSPAKYTIRRQLLRKKPIDCVSIGMTILRGDSPFVRGPRTPIARGRRQTTPPHLLLSTDRRHHPGRKRSERAHEICPRPIAAGTIGAGKTSGGHAIRPALA
jgi:hypothetical protein